MNGKPPNSTFAPNRVVRNFRELRHDIWTLVRLQFELFRVDLSGWQQQVKTPLVLLALATIIALGSVPVLLLGISYALSGFTGLPEALSHEITAVGGLLVAIILALYAQRRIKAANATFERSQQELRENIRWINELLQGGGSTEPAAQQNGRTQPR